MSKLTEKDLQDLLFCYPYLINFAFMNCFKQQYYPLNCGYADMVIFILNKVFVIELKIDSLKKVDVLQLADYVFAIKLRFPNDKVEAILIGRTPKYDLNTLINTYDFPIEIKIIEEDIPIRVKICESCRSANSIVNLHCWNCMNHVFLDLTKQKRKMDQ